MQSYSNVNGNSNVEAYEIGDTYIEVKFRGTARIYRYSYGSAGIVHVETMKELAKQGHGLNSYIMKNVRYGYEK